MPGKLTITFDTKPIFLLLLNSKVSAINKLGKYLGKDRNGMELGGREIEKFKQFIEWEIVGK